MTIVDVGGTSSSWLRDGIEVSEPYILEGMVDSTVTNKFIDHVYHEAVPYMEHPALALAEYVFACNLMSFRQSETSLSIVIEDENLRA